MWSRCFLKALGVNFFKQESHCIFLNNLIISTLSGLKRIPYCSWDCLGTCFTILLAKERTLYDKHCKPNFRNFKGVQFLSPLKMWNSITYSSYIHYKIGFDRKVFFFVKFRFFWSDSSNFFYFKEKGGNTRLKETFWKIHFNITNNPTIHQ